MEIVCFPDRLKYIQQLEILSLLFILYVYIFSYDAAAQHGP